MRFFCVLFIFYAFYNNVFRKSTIITFRRVAKLVKAGHVYMIGNKYD